MKLKFFKKLIQVILRRSRRILPSHWLRRARLSNQLYYYTAIGLVLLIGGGIFAYQIMHPTSSKAAWFDENYLYRQPINVTVTASTSAAFDLETLLTVDTATPIAAGKMQTSCADMRFTSQGGDLLPYYLDSGCNTSSTKVWVMVDQIPANSTQYTAFFYYGNQQAQSASNSTLFNLFRNLVGYWTQNETSWNGTSGEVKDSSVNGNNGTASNSATTTLAGRYANAGSFSGTNLVSIPSSSPLVFANGSDITLSAWINPSSIVSTGQSIIVKDRQSGNGTNYALRTNANATIEFYYRNSTNTAFDVATTGNNVYTASVWQHVVATYTFGQGSSLKIYVNGVSQNYTWTTGTGDDAPYTSTNPLDIGAINASGTQGWIGNLDDTRIYSRAFSATDVQQLYQNPGTIASVATTVSQPTASFGTEEQSPSPVAYWTFDEGTGNVASSSASPSLPGGVMGGASWSAQMSCVSANCLSFDGVNDYVNVGDVSILEPTNVSIGTWVKLNGTPSAARQIAGKYDHTNKKGYKLGIEGATGKAYVQIGTGSTTPYAISSSSVADNRWHYILGVNDGVNISLYVDGVLVNTASSGAISYGGEPFTIARTSVDTLNYLTGQIDEVKVYPFALSADQVKANYNSRGGIIGQAAVLGATQNSVLSNGLVGYWKMDEASWNGTAGEVIDSSGNSNNGTSVSGANASPSAKFGNSGFFAGVDEYVSVANSASLNPSTITLSAWIKTSYSGTYQHIINKDTSSAGRVWQFRIAVTSGVVQFLPFNATTNGSCSGTTNVTDGNWHQVAATWDGQDIRIFVDGRVENSCSFTGSLRTGQVNIVTIGTYNDAGSGNIQFFRGNIDEARVYNRAMSPMEVAQLYSFAPGPVGYWNFEEGTGATANDTSGNGYTGTITGSTWTTGKFGKALYFDGVNNYAEVPNSTSLNPTGQISIGAWIKPISGMGQYAVVVAKPIGGWTTGGYGLTRNASTDNLTFWVNTYTNNVTIPFTYNEWQYVAATYDGSTMKIFKNGSLVDSKSYSTAITQGSEVLRIGKPITYDYPFKGSIDDVKIYNYARTPAQIISDMQAGAPPVTAGGKTTLGYWKLNDGYGTVASDSSSLRTNGEIYSATWSNSGKFGKALYFNNAGTVKLGNVSAYKTDNKTISFWANPTATLSEIKLVMGSGISNWYVGFDTGNKMISSHSTSAPAQQVTRSDANVVTLNEWHLYTFSFAVSGSSVTITMFKDGNQVKQTSYATGYSTTYGTNFTLGSLNSTSNFYIGYLDEVKFYNYVLTPQDVKAEYNHGSSLVLGSFGMSSSGVASNAASAVYCVPGSTDTCNPPVGEWNFDNRGAATVADTSGNNYNGTLTNGPKWVVGKIGSAIDVNNTNTSYVNMGDNLDLIGLPLTISAWVKPRTYVNFGAIVNKLATAGNYRLTIDSTGKLLFGIRNSAGTFEGVSSNSSIPLNQWSHVVVTYDNSTTAKIYINGKLDLTSAAFTISRGDTATALTIGYNANNAAYFDGAIDQVRIYNYVRTDSQVAWEYSNGKPVSRWKFDECQGPTAHDLIGTSSGTIMIGSSGTQTTVGTCQVVNTAAAWYNGRVGKYNSSLNFDGTDDYVQLPNLNLTGTGKDQITVAGWAKRSSGTGGTVFNFGVDTVNLFFSGNTPTCYIRNSSSTIATAQSSSTTSTGQWYHLVCTYDGSSVKIYVNGILKGTASQTGSIRNSEGGTGYTIGAGVAYPSLVLAEYMIGQIDDVQIYNYPLTPVQIRGVYNQNSAVRFGPNTGAP